MAREGAHGKILLARDVSDSALSFSRGGCLHPQRYALHSAAGLGVTVDESPIRWVG